MTNDESEPTIGAQDPTIDGNGPAAGHATGVMTSARTRTAAAGRVARRVVARIPGTLRFARTRARQGTRALQVLPDPTLRSLATSSVGLGAGLYLAGAPRLVVMAGVVPAVLMRAAISLRPSKPIGPAVPIVTS